jgi:alkylated DNA repair dioxygenase AlkB
MENHEQPIRRIESHAKIGFLRTVLPKGVNYLSLNRYPDGSAGIGFHNHKEDLAINTPVFLVSLGSERTMWLRETGREATATPILLQHGSLLVMPAALNLTHQHGVLPEKHITGVRYSFNCKCLPTEAL